MRLTRTQQTSPFLYQIVPLVDILFALLVFFGLTTIFISQPGLTVEPPASSFILEQALRSQIVSITSGRPFKTFFRDRQVSEKELITAFTLQKTDGEATIIIKADRAVPYAEVMRVTNLALSHGYRVTIAGGTSNGRIEVE